MARTFDTCSEHEACQLETITHVENVFIDGRKVNGSAYMVEVHHKAQPQPHSPHAPEGRNHYSDMRDQLLNRIQELLDRPKPPTRWERAKKRLRVPWEV